MSRLESTSRRRGTAPPTLALALALGWLTATPAMADETTEERVLVLAADDDVSSMLHHELWMALRAQLSGMPLGVWLTTVAGPVDAAEARRQQQASGALSVTWMSADARTFHVYTPALDGEARARVLPESAGDTLARCQAMAAIVRAELEPLFAPAAGEGAAAAGADGAVSPGDDTPHDDTPHTDDAGAAADTAAPAPRSGLVGWAVALRTGYALDRPSRTDAPLHGALIGVDARLGRHVGVALSFQLAQPQPLSIAAPAEAAGARIARWPLRLALTGEFAVGRLEVGGWAGVVVEPWQVRDLGYTAAVEGATGIQLDLGISVGAELRLRALSWLAPFVAGGLDLLPASTSLVVGEVEAGRRDAVAPRLIVGVRWTFATGEAS